MKFKNLFNSFMLVSTVLWWITLVLIYLSSQYIPTLILLSICSTVFSLHVGQRIKQRNTTLW